MSLAIADSELNGRAAPSRTAFMVILVLALALHLVVVALVFWASPQDGTVAEGQGGLTVGLGPAGAAPGALEAVEADRLDASTTDAPLSVEAIADTAVEVSPAASTAAAVKPTVPSEPMPDRVKAQAPPAASSAEPQPESAPHQANVVESVAIAESVAPVLAQPTPFSEVNSREEAPAVSEVPATEVQSDVDPIPVTPAEVAPDATTRSNLAPDAIKPEAPISKTITATVPQAGLGVSLRPVKRSAAVEEAGRKAVDAKVAAEKARQQRQDARTQAAPSNPSPTRDTASEQQGQGGNSQGGTSGDGDGTSSGGNPGARADFAALVAARLARAKQYPRAAQQRRLSGTGVVWFRMNAAGTVTASRLTRSTGHPILDQEIIRTLRRARLPSIPASVGESQMEFSVPMAFSVR